MGKDRAEPYFSGMFEEWKRAWEQAVENFERELRAPDQDFASPSQKAHAMRRDLNAARTALNRLQADLVQARKDLAAEEESEQTARRRAEMAQRIEDQDTIRIALEFAERHAQRAGILRRKVDVLHDEHTMRQEELTVMEQQAATELQQIEARQAIDSLEREKQDADFRRMERARREKEAEARLEELKKRMK
jgi:chromosome segregation ATPase